MTKAKTVQGKKCGRCGSTERYVTSKQCAPCHRMHCKAMRAKARGKPLVQNSLHARGLIPDAPQRGKNWPREKAADGTTIPADPMMVMVMSGKHEPGRFE